MAKKNKKQASSFNDVNESPFTKTRNQKKVSKPEVVNMDDIALLLDEELHSKITSLEEGRNKAMSQGYDPYYWEVELAYHKRESSLRRVRHEIHENWVKEQISLSNIDESNLPSPDFDNLKYVMVNLYEKNSNRLRNCIRLFG